MLEPLLLRLDRPNHKEAIVFDIDSTLLNNRRRNLEIFRDFGRREKIEKLIALKEEMIQNWLIPVTLKNAGFSKLESIQLFPKLNEFWRKAFFSPDYCHFDEPIEGASEFLSLVSKRGFNVIYCTGRHLEMAEATRKSLNSFGFPTEGEKIRWYFKPQQAMHDFEYKEAACKEIVSRFPIAAVFENEPKNLQMMGEVFSSAIPVLLDTDCFHPTFPLTLPNLFVMENFKVLTDRDCHRKVSAP